MPSPLHRSSRAKGAKQPKPRDLRLFYSIPASTFVIPSAVEGPAVRAIYFFSKSYCFAGSGSRLALR
jgi:hypothetical protein